MGGGALSVGGGTGVSVTGSDVTIGVGELVNVKVGSKVAKGVLVGRWVLVGTKVPSLTDSLPSDWDCGVQVGGTGGWVDVIDISPTDTIASTVGAATAAVGIADSGIHPLDNKTIVPKINVISHLEIWLFPLSVLLCMIKKIVKLAIMMVKF